MPSTPRRIDAQHFELPEKAGLTESVHPLREHLTSTAGRIPSRNLLGNQLLSALWTIVCSVDSGHLITPKSNRTCVRSIAGSGMRKKASRCSARPGAVWSTLSNPTRRLSVADNQNHYGTTALILQSSKFPSAISCQA